ncbi:class I SAM-dependent methyltransferase [Motilibacter aurantiacus]|uniref:class I SAM-dependent methyltransferase n=1 Tax=Motilibacter aurantiacus TaxID=2714955 RepID=UPI00140B3CB7|nr:class I SAM-dependent methyltransferase [Motilibacter aurantiacus]NHC44264.1 class I SAM-dependent methyltransferase [Motilibacter aurantiacus]
MTSASHVQDNLNAYWSGRSVPYDAYQLRPERYEADRKAWAEAFCAALPAAPADVLDLGTGSGYVSTLLAELGHRVVGTDLAEGMVEVARAHAGRMASPPRIELGDAVAPAYPDESFDAITNRYVMWTLREPMTALANWKRVLRPGGVLAVVDATWFPDGLDEGTPEFTLLYDETVAAALRLATSRSIEDTALLVKQAGFEDVTVTPLEAIYALDSAHGVADHHELQMQYLVRAVRP